MSNGMWKVKKNDGKVYGPADTETFRQWIGEQRILGEDLVSPAEKQEWKTAKSLSEFADLFAPAVQVLSPGTGQVPSGEKNCPSCGNSLAAEATFCVKCGTDLKTGQKVGEMQVEKAKKGVDMASVSSANFFQRLLAYILDSIILNVVLGMLWAPVFAKVIMGAKQAAEMGPEAAGQISVGPMASILPWIGIFLALFYYIFFWTKFGATPGKMALKLKVVREDGSYLSIGGAIIRLIGYWVSSFFSLGYLWMIWDPQNQCWHDKMAKSYVVVVR